MANYCSEKGCKNIIEIPVRGLPSLYCPDCREERRKERKRLAMQRSRDKTKQRAKIQQIESRPANGIDQEGPNDTPASFSVADAVPTVASTPPVPLPLPETDSRPQNDLVPVSLAGNDDKTKTIIKGMWDGTLKGAEFLSQLPLIASPEKRRKFLKNAVDHKRFKGAEFLEAVDLLSSVDVLPKQQANRAPNTVRNPGLPAGWKPRKFEIHEAEPKETPEPKPFVEKKEKTISKSPSPEALKLLTIHQHLKALVKEIAKNQSNIVPSELRGNHLSIPRLNERGMAVYKEAKQEYCKVNQIPAWMMEEVEKFSTLPQIGNRILVGKSLNDRDRIFVPATLPLEVAADYYPKTSSMYSTMDNPKYEPVPIPRVLSAEEKAQAEADREFDARQQHEEDMKERARRATEADELSAAEYFRHTGY